MDRSTAKVVPSMELLKEMEELKIMGGFDPHSDGDVINQLNCVVYSGNCVVKCDCEEGDQ